MNATDIKTHPVHLGTGARAEIEPRFDGSWEWYTAYAQRHAGDGAEGRLVAMHSFTAPWPSWEMHPLGAELVLCVEGEMTLIQEMPDGEHHRTALTAGEYAINPPGVWHTADIAHRATAVFVTAGLGTEHRDRG